MCMHASAHMYFLSHSVSTWNAGVRGSGTPIIVCECLDEKDVP